MEEGAPEGRWVSWILGRSSDIATRTGSRGSLGLAYSTVDGSTSVGSSDWTEDSWSRVSKTLSTREASWEMIGGVRETGLNSVMTHPFCQLDTHS